MSDATGATRRALIRAAAAGAAMTAAGGTAARASDAQGLDLANPVDALRASRLMDASLRDGAGVLSVGRGTLYAAPDPTRAAWPILSLTVVETAAAWTLDCGRYGLARKRLVLFTSLGGDDLVTRFKNPFNGHLCRPFSAVEELHEVVAANAAAAADRRSTWAAVGDRMVRTLNGVDSRAHPLDPAVWPHQSSGAQLRTRYVAKASAPAAALAGRRALKVQTSATEAAPWQPWMLMGASHGGVVMETRLSTVADLSGLGALAAHVEREHGDVLAPPDRWSPRRDDAYALYARRRSPLGAQGAVA